LGTSSQPIVKPPVIAPGRDDIVFAVFQDVPALDLDPVDLARLEI